MGITDQMAQAMISDHSPELDIVAVVGLGNPGAKYASTRHNAGFGALDELARRWQVTWRVGATSFVYAQRQWPEKVSLLVKPLTFMNRSGIAIDDLMHKFGIASHEILVIHDDLDLEFGRLRLVARGGAGGHRGVQSIIEHTGSNAVARIKIGIGRPKTGQAIEDYVLEPPYAEQADIFQSTLSRAGDAAETVLRNGVQVAMNQFNRRVPNAEGGATAAAKDAPV